MNAPVTSGGPPGTNGVTRGVTHEAAENRRFRFPLWFWAVYAFALLIFAAMIGSSYWMEAGRAGIPVPVWHIVVNEATSIVIVFAATPAVFAWAARLDPHRIGWPLVILGHLAGMVAFAAVHIGGMTLLRLLVYPLFGGSYGIGDDPLLLSLIYEGRKDALAYAAMVLGAWLLEAALRKPEPVVITKAAEPSRRRLEIRDGARREYLDPAEILFVEAAGNYVELHLPGRALLQRQTLSAMESELAALGFIRIHRSRLVNRRHVQAVESNESGDFTLRLSDGRQIAGSRRFREALQL